MIYSIDLRERVIAFIENGGKKLEASRAYVNAHPDEMLEDYAAHFQTSSSGIWRALKRLKITRKKDNSLQRTG
jgi:hypothetical protein